MGAHPATSIEETGFRRTSDFLSHPVFNKSVKFISGFSCLPIYVENFVVMLN